ncbi:hypothetical protein FMM68_07570 [Lachnospiraceae bacterium MD329]|nr:hypothetical protein [Lachnospiraceae bacterium MD329]
MKKNFITGFITGGIICAAVTGFAVEYAVTANPYPVKVNGVETAIQGYNINDETYFKLRDVSAAVGGFDVGFSDNTITIATEQQPEPTIAPAPTPANLSASDITIVKGEDGNDYTSDGLIVEHTDEGDFVFKWDILNMMENQDIKGYGFGGKYFFKKGSKENILDDIPLHPEDNLLIPIDYYVSTIQPLIQTLKAE